MLNSGLWKRFTLALVAATVVVFAGQLPGAQPATGKKSARVKAAKGDSKASPAGEGVTLTPAVFLIRDPVVLGELDLSADQQTALGELAPAANEEAWKFRDLVPQAGKGSEAIQTVNDRLESRRSEPAGRETADRTAEGSACDADAGAAETVERTARQGAGPGKAAAAPCPS